MTRILHSLDYRAGTGPLLEPLVHKFVQKHARDFPKLHAKTLLPLAERIYSGIDWFRSEWVNGGVFRRDESRDIEQSILSDARRRVAELESKHTLASNADEKRATIVALEVARAELNECESLARFESTLVPLSTAVITTREIAEQEIAKKKIQLQIWRDLSERLAKYLPSSSKGPSEATELIKLHVLDCDRRIQAATALIAGYEKQRQQAEGYVSPEDVIAKARLKHEIETQPVLTLRLIDFLVSELTKMSSGEKVARMQRDFICGKLNSGEKFLAAYAAAFDEHYGRPINYKTGMTSPRRAQSELSAQQKWEAVRKGIDKARSWDAANAVGG